MTDAIRIIVETVGLVPLVLSGFLICSVSACFGFLLGAIIRAGSDDDDQYNNPDHWGKQ